MTDSQKLLLDYAKERKTNRDIPRPTMPNDYYSPEFFDKKPETEQEIIQLLGRKWKDNLTSIGTFFEMFKYITVNYLTDDDYDNDNDNDDDESSSSEEEVGDTSCKKKETEEDSPLMRTFVLRDVSVLHISTTSPYLLAVYGSHSQISRLLVKLVKINGLAVVNDFYRYGGGRYYNRCRSYAYNKKTEKLVLGMVKKYKIELLKSSPVIKEQPQDKALSASQKSGYGLVRVASNLRIKGWSDADCEAALWHRYGKLLAPRIDKINEMNTSLPSEETIKMRWNIHRSKTNLITKIGIRASSAIASFRKNNDSQAEMANELGFSIYSHSSRSEYLKQRFLGHDWFEHDIRGSVYAVSHLLNFGQWLGNSTDPYPLMFGNEFNSKSERSIYKSICMALYFDNELQIIHHNRRYTPVSLKTHTANELSTMIRSARSSMKSFTGDFFGSEISCMNPCFTLISSGNSVSAAYQSCKFMTASICQAKASALTSLKNSCANAP